MGAKSFSMAAHRQLLLLLSFAAVKGSAEYAYYGYYTSSGCDGSPSVEIQYTVDECSCYSLIANTACTSYSKTSSATVGAFGFGATAYTYESYDSSDSSCSSSTSTVPMPQGLCIGYAGYGVKITGSPVRGTLGLTCTSSGCNINSLWGVTNAAGKAARLTIGATFLALFAYLWA